MFSTVRARFGAAAAAAALLAVGVEAAPRTDAGPHLRPAGATATKARPRVERLRAPGELFRFHVGSAIAAAPAVDEDGTVYVGGSDGVLVAIDVSGALRWSFTLKGPVVSSPVIAGGRVFVATASGRLSSVWPSGKPGTDVRTPGGVATDVVLSPRYGLLFGGTDGALWAYSTRGTALWHSPIGDVLGASPGQEGGRIGAVTRGGDLVALDGATRRVRVRLGMSPTGAPVVGRDGSLAVVAGGALHGVDAKGVPRFRREKARFVASGEESRLLVVESTGALVTLSAEGVELRRAVLGFSASAAPVAAADGRIYVAGEGGEVAIIAPDGSVDVVRVGRTALHRPVIDGPRRRLVLAAGSGEVIAMEVR